MDMIFWNLTMAVKSTVESFDSLACKHFGQMLHSKKWESAFLTDIQASVIKLMNSVNTGGGDVFDKEFGVFSEADVDSMKYTESRGDKEADVYTESEPGVVDDESPTEFADVEYQLGDKCFVDDSSPKYKLNRMMMMNRMNPVETETATISSS